MFVFCSAFGLREDADFPFASGERRIDGRDIWRQRHKRFLADEALPEQQRLVNGLANASSE